MTTQPRSLRTGEAVPLDQLGLDPRAPLVVAVTAAVVDAAATPDLVALAVDASGKVRTDDDLVFYNNPTSVDGALAWQDRAGTSERVQIQPNHLDPGITRVVLGCAGGALDTGAPVPLTLTIAGPDGALVASAQFASDPGHRAVIAAEVYRRGEQWRCRLLAQGYANGLAALVTEFGVDVDDPGEVEPTTSAPAAAPAQQQPAPTSQPVPPPAASAPPSLGAAAPAQPSPWPRQPPAAYAPQQSAPVPQPGWAPLPHGAHLWPSSQPPPPSAGPQMVRQPTQPSDQPRRGGLFTSRKRAQLEAQNAELNRLLAATGAMDNAAIAAERHRLAGEVAALAAEADRRRADLAGLEHRLAQVRAEIAVAEGDAELAEVGIYHYRHRLDDSIAYKSAIESLRDRIKACASAGRAVTGATSWHVNGSLAQGRRMVNEVSKLMLRAYNADADHAVRTMRAYKLDSALARLDTTRRTIAKLGQTMTIAVTDEYHRLRRQELELTADYLTKVEEEKERQRQLREEQREQQRAEAEYAREQARLERDRDKYADALARLEVAGKAQEAIEVRSQLTSVKAALDQLSYRRANLRLGWVYVISNVGAFGQRMVKIGMTRRIDPMDRVRELGDASVPFRFDVHALIFSEDAVALETALHQRFAEMKVNRVNQHREFFYVTPADVREALAQLAPSYLVEYREDVIAEEWRQSGGPDRALLPT